MFAHDCLTIGVSSSSKPCRPSETGLPPTCTRTTWYMITENNSCRWHVLQHRFLAKSNGSHPIYPGGLLAPGRPVPHGREYNHQSLMLPSDNPPWPAASLFLFGGCHKSSFRVLWRLPMQDCYCDFAATNSALATSNFAISGVEIEAHVSGFCSSFLDTA